MSQHELLQELSLLQDRVPAFDPARAVAIIEQELGMPLASAYRSFEREPIAAASLGQVRRGGLLSTRRSGKRYIHMLSHPWMISRQLEPLHIRQRQQRSPNAAARQSAEPL